MNRLRSAKSWLRSVIFRSRVEREMDAELKWHIERYIQDLTKAGVPLEEAKRRARMSFGEIDVQKENCRDSLGLRLWDELRDDIRFALRSFGKQRLLTVSVLLTLTLGIGISSGVFTFVEAAALRAHVSKDRKSYIQIFSYLSIDAAHSPSPSMATLEDYSVFLDKAKSLRDIAAWGDFYLNFQSDHLHTVHTLLVSSNFFSLYGMEKAKLGRLLQPADYGSASPVIVLSENVWRDRFGADTAIVGKTIHVSGKLLTVVGVVPSFADGRTRGEAWLPYTLANYLELGNQLSSPSEVRWLGLAARLNAGFSRSDASAELNLLLSQLDKLQPGRRSSVIVTDGSELQEPWDTPIRSMVGLIIGLQIMVLLISCANVATLLLARADARQQEMGVRLALGARRIRIIRMLLVETVLLASTAGLASLYFTYRLPASLLYWLGASDPGFSLEPDWRVFSYLALSILLVGILAGLAPALESLNIDLLSILKGNRRISKQSSRRWDARSSLVATQVAISLVLLVGAALFVRAHHQLVEANPGFETRQMIMVDSFDPSAKTEALRASFRDSVSQRIAAVPGVQAIASANNLPYSWNQDQIELQLPGKAAFNVTAHQISGNYFDTLRIPILRGRPIERTDAPCDAHSVCPVVVSQEFAREYLNGVEVIGKTLRKPTGEILEIVGISAGVVSAPFTSTYQPAIYQALPLNSSLLQLPLMVRVSGDVESASSTIHTMLRTSYPEAEIETRTIRSSMESVANMFGRLVALLLILASIGVLLAVIGIYGVVSFSVSRRMKEIGIRIALGAMKKNIYATIMKSGFRAICAGLVIGIFLSLCGARVLQQALRFTPLDYYRPLSYAAPACLLLVVSTIAMLVPARRAAECDPSTSLRDE